MSEEAEVAVSVLNDLGEDVAVLCLRGVLFALDYLDAGVYVAVGADELRGGVKEEKLLRFLITDVVQDDAILDSNLKQVVSHLNLLTVLSFFIPILISRIANDRKLCRLGNFTEIGVEGISISLAHDTQVNRSCFIFLPPNQVFTTHGFGDNFATFTVSVLNNPFD